MQVDVYKRQTVASFLTIYGTDVAGIAAGVVGTLMLIARLFDGVSDLFMGVIIDKTNTRWGKARPWVLWSAPPVSYTHLDVYKRQIIQLKSLQ